VRHFTDADYTHHNHWNGYKAARWCICAGSVFCIWTFAVGAVALKKQKMNCRVTREDLKRLFFCTQAGKFKLLNGVCDSDRSSNSGMPPPLPTCNWHCRISAAFHKIRARLTELPADFPSETAVASFLALVNGSGKQVLQCPVCMDRLIFYKPCTCAVALCQVCAQLALRKTLCISCRQPNVLSTTVFIEKQLI
jgi:hypothetical protein